MDIYSESLKAHEKWKGKLETKLKMPLTNKQELSLAYTPGVAEPCKEIYKDPKKVYRYTIKQNTIAVITDGSAVLGLGNIGPEAALPVMEGKCALFKEFADINAFPICLSTQDSKEIIKTVKNIAPVFAGINLEDISAPRCFVIEQQLQELGIPVFHDDQHGTAIVVFAALLNALKVVNKSMEDINIAISGAGAAGTAITTMLTSLNQEKHGCNQVKDIIVVDSKGIICKDRKDLNDPKQKLVSITNKNSKSGTLSDAIKGADVFIGISKAGIVTEEMISSMNEKAIVLAMANPVPEIMPDLAAKSGAAVIGTGRSDFPNQINNVLAFPGVFRGAIDANATKITEEMKHAAAQALANCIPDPTADKILPSPLSKEVVPKVAEAVRQQAIKEGVIRT
jgi:malate dehydrogenase (oxaloacetate-decarboxylating)